MTQDATVRKPTTEQPEKRELPPMTVGQLKEWLEKHGIDDDTEVFVERDSMDGDRYQDVVPYVTLELTSNGYSRVVINIKP